MSGGSLTQIIATGALDSYLHENATVSHWKVRYARHTNFATESCSQPFSTPVSFGAEAQLQLNRQGDLVHYQYVVIDLPAIVACDMEKEGGCAGLGGGSMFPTYMENSCAPCAKEDAAIFADYGGDDMTDSSSDAAAKLKKAKDAYYKSKFGSAPGLEGCEDVYDCPDNLLPEMGGVWCHYVNAVGQFLIKNAKVIIGGSTVDQLWSEFLFIFEELQGRAGRRLTEMIGKRYTRTSLVCEARQARQLWVPLPWWYTLHSGNALSLASLQFHGVSLHVEFAKLEHCIVVSGPNVTVKNAKTGTALQNNDLKAHLETTFVFLENSERERFSSNHFEVLVTQHQAFFTQTTSAQPRIQLNFNHPCLELLIACRRQCHERTNNWFNFSGPDGRDSIVSADLLLNNQSRFGKKSGQYLRTVVPFQHHSNIPDAFIYCMSFSLRPEDVSPSGSCNFSRIDHCDLMLELADGLANSPVTIMVFAVNYNVLRFREGLAGIAFSS